LILPPYNFDAAQIGLMGIPLFIGSCLAMLILGPLGDRLVLWSAKNNNGIYEPETRLWLVATFGLFASLGIFMAGFGLTKGYAWPVVAVATGFLGFGMSAGMGMSFLYEVDSYLEVRFPCT
jgi:MFS family permease